MNYTKPSSNSNKLVINFSTLNLWSKSLIDQAVQCYYHTDKFDSDAMADGRAFHDIWAREITRTKRLKIGNTTLLFKEPQCEHLIQTDYNKDWLIKGTMDCIDESTLYEFKTGITKALDFSGTMQIPIYFLINELVGNHLDKAILLHFDQHHTKTEYIMVWNDEEKMMGARNWIDTLAPEITEYFNAHNLSFDTDTYLKI